MWRPRIIRARRRRIRRQHSMSSRWTGWCARRPGAQCFLWRSRSVSCSIDRIRTPFARCISSMIASYDCRCVSFGREFLVLKQRPQHCRDFTAPRCRVSPNVMPAMMLVGGCWSSIHSIVKLWSSSCSSCTTHKWLSVDGIA